MNKLIERFTPKSKLDAVVLFLVLLQMVYCLWELSTHPLKYMLLGVYAIVFFALPAYLRGKKWAWALIFLFSVYILHQAIFLKHNWYYESSYPSPLWLAILLIIASPLCLRVLGAGAKSHSIDRREFGKVLGAIALFAIIIFIRANLLSPGEAHYGRPLTRWEYLVYAKVFRWESDWMILALLWLSYAAIAIVFGICRKKKSEAVVQV
jgi:hypothetical protein